MTNRTQRRQKFQYFDFNPDAPENDVFEYSPSGKGFKLTIHPRLSTGWPSLTLDIPTRAKPTDSFPFMYGGIQRIEHQNQVYKIWCIGIGSSLLILDKHLPACDAGMVCAVCDDSGKLLKLVTVDRPAFIDHGESSALFALAMLDFGLSGKQLDRELKTKVEPINEENLSHYFQATAALPGGNVATVRRPVKEIRDNGKKVDGFNFWTFGYSLTVGDRVAFIGGDYTNRFHGQIFEAGNLTTTFESSSYQQTVLTIFQALNS